MTCTLTGYILERMEDRLLDIVRRIANSWRTT